MTVELSYANDHGHEDATGDLASLGGLDALALPQLPTTYDWSQQDIPAGAAAGARIELFTFQPAYLPNLKQKIDASFPTALREVGFERVGASTTSTATVTVKWTEVTKTVKHDPPLAAGYRSWNLVVTSGPNRVIGHQLGGTLGYQVDPTKVPTQAAFAGNKLVGIHTTIVKPSDGKFDYVKATGLSQAVNAVYRAYNAANGVASGGLSSIALRMITVLPVGAGAVARVPASTSLWLLLLAGAAVVVTSGGKGAAAAKAAPFAAKGAMVAGKAALVGAKKAGALLASRGF